MDRLASHSRRRRARASLAAPAGGAVCRARGRSRSARPVAAPRPPRRAAGGLRGDLRRRLARDDGDDPRLVSSRLRPPSPAASPRTPRTRRSARKTPRGRGGVAREHDVDLAARAPLDRRASGIRGRPAASRSGVFSSASRRGGTAAVFPHPSTRWTRAARVGEATALDRVEVGRVERVGRVVGRGGAGEGVGRDDGARGGDEALQLGRDRRAARSAGASWARWRATTPGETPRARRRRPSGGDRGVPAAGWLDGGRGLAQDARRPGAPSVSYAERPPERACVDEIT